MSIDALHKVIKLAGSQENLAKSINRSQNAVSYWVRTNKSIPAEHVLDIENLYGVSRHDLRPDIYPLEENRGPRDAP